MNSPDRSSESATLRAMRKFLLALFAFGVIGTIAELLLLGHTEKIPQFAPLLLMAISLLVLAWRIRDRGAFSLRIFQIVMIFFVASGFAGLWLHYKANVEFEQEMYPSLRGIKLFFKAIKGTAPPSLAPGTMFVLGLIGLLYTYRHPAFNKTEDKGEAS